MRSIFINTGECVEGSFHLCRVVERFRLAGHCIDLEQAREGVAILADDNVMGAVFQPARVRRRAVEVDALRRIENIVDGEEFLLCLDRINQHQRQDS